MLLRPESSLAEFFRESVVDTIRVQGVPASEPTEFYLVNLLATFSTQSPDDEPLGLKLAQAATASPDERLRSLREIGDTSLYVSGFFSESLERRRVDRDYYIRIGGTAYAQLAGMYRTRSANDLFAVIYNELGSRFALFVDVLHEISEAGSLNSDQGLMNLYARWRKTGAEWMERRLRQSGVIVPKGEVQ